MKGTSLGEVVVAVLIMSALFSMATPQLIDWRQSASYRQAAREIVSALRLARSHAINRTREVEIDFDLDTNRYRMRVGNLAYGSSDWQEVQGWSPLPTKVRLGTTKSCGKIGDGDVLTPHIDTIQFNPNGTCGASGNMAGYYICVMSRNLEPRFAGAILSTTTGRATVRSWDAEKGEWQ